MSKILVVGGTSGIGLATAELFVQQLRDGSMHLTNNFLSIFQVKLRFK